MTEWLNVVSQSAMTLEVGLEAGLERTSAHLSQ